MASVPIAASFAQGAPAGFMDAYDEEHEEAGVHCAGLSWHIDRVAQPDKTVNISGPIWYTDGSGVSFAQGKGQADGHFTLKVTTMSGIGPAGTLPRQHWFDGRRTPVLRRDAS